MTLDVKTALCYITNDTVQAQKYQIWTAVPKTQAYEYNPYPSCPSTSQHKTELSL